MAAASASNFDAHHEASVRPEIAKVCTTTGYSNDAVNAQPACPGQPDE
jgi:hypothetical protein